MVPTDEIPPGVLAGDTPPEALAGDIPQGGLADDIPATLGDGVDGHDLRVAGKGDVFDETFLAEDGFGVSFLGFVD